MEFRDFIESFEDQPNPWFNTRPKNRTPGLGPAAQRALTIRFGDSVTVPTQVARRIADHYGVPFPNEDETVVLRSPTDSYGMLTMRRTGKNQFSISHANDPLVSRHARTDIPYTG